MRSCIVALKKKHRDQVLECKNTAPCVAHLPEEGQRFLFQRARCSIVAPNEGAIPSGREGVVPASSSPESRVQSKPFLNRGAGLPEPLRRGANRSGTDPAFRR